MILVSKHNYLVNEQINKIDFYKKFTLKYIKTNGYNIKDVLCKLSDDIKICKYIVGHNIISFDLVHIHKYFNKYNIQFSTPIVIDTMLVGKSIFNLRTKNGMLKYPSLKEAHSYYYPNEIKTDLQHDASYDVHITFQVFNKFVDNNIISIIK